MRPLTEDEEVETLAETLQREFPTSLQPPTTCDARFVARGTATATPASDNSFPLSCAATHARCSDGNARLVHTRREVSHRPCHCVCDAVADPRSRAACRSAERTPNHRRSAADARPRSPRSRPRARPINTPACTRDESGSCSPGWHHRSTRYLTSSPSSAWPTMSSSPTGYCAASHASPATTSSSSTGAEVPKASPPSNICFASITTTALAPSNKIVRATMSRTRQVTVGTNDKDNSHYEDPSARAHSDYVSLRDGSHACPNRERRNPSRERRPAGIWLGLRLQDQLPPSGSVACDRAVGSGGVRAGSSISATTPSCWTRGRRPMPRT